MSARLNESILKFAESLPLWQKILAVPALDESKSPSLCTEEVELSTRLYKEDLGLMAVTMPCPTPKFLFDHSSKFIPGPALPLREIRDCKNVNAIRQDQKITFAPKLTIVYGENGSGKSGYSRVMNNAFYSRAAGAILPNINSDSMGAAVSATFEFGPDGSKLTRQYPADLAKPEFQAFACFDSRAVSVHLEKANELYIVPREMAFFERLATLVNLVQKSIQNEIAEKSKFRDFVEKFDGISAIKSFIQSIEGIAKIGDLEEFARAIPLPNLGEIESAEIEFLQHKQIDPVQELQQLDKIRDELVHLKERYKSIVCNIATPASGLEVKQSILDLSVAESEASLAGALQFKSELLSSVGSREWKAFLVASNSLCGAETGNRGRSFPTEHDSCPLCRKTLGADGSKLIAQYFTYLASQCEEKAAGARSRIDELSLRFKDVDLDSLMPSARLSIWLDENCREVRDDLANLKTRLSVWKETSIQSLAERNDSLMPKEIVADVDSYFLKAEQALKIKISGLNQIEFQNKFDLLADKVTALSHARIFNQSYAEIEAYVRGRLWAGSAQKVISFSPTRSITDFQKKLFDQHFTAGYRAQFKKELKALNLDFDVSVKTKGAAGTSTRKLDILKYSPIEILSEGEQRVVALADFLTEVEICSINGGLFFDDPVNSLDHNRKSIIADRLVLESKKRQVVIFTHDMSFYFDLVNAADSAGLEFNQELFCHWVQRLDDHTGIVELGLKKSFERDFKSTHRAEAMRQKAVSELNPELREQLSKQGFSCLRSTYEAFVIIEVLKETITRFDRQVRHKTIRDIYCTRDIGRKISAKLELLSGFIDGHLGADRYTGERASPERLKREIDDFTDFQKEYLSARVKYFAST